MKLSRCPICHSAIHLEALIQDEAASELLGVLAKLDRPLALSMVSYLGLFRPEKSDLSNSRALRLVKEVQDLGQGGPLVSALEQTVNQIRQKRQQGHMRSLTNHNYLKTVLNGLLTQYQTQAAPTGKAKAASVPVKKQEDTAAHKAANKALWEKQMREYGMDPDKYKSNKSEG